MAIENTSSSSSLGIKNLQQPRVISVQINKFKLRLGNSNLDMLLWNKGEKEGVDQEVMAVEVAELRDKEEEVVKLMISFSRKSIHTT